MESKITNRLNEIERQLPYFQPTSEWQPQKYNVFIKRLECIIEDLVAMKEKLINGNTNSNQEESLKIEHLLQSYLTMREKYF